MPARIQFPWWAAVAAALFLILVDARQANALAQIHLRASQGPAPSVQPVGEAGTTYHYGSNLVCSDCHIMHASEEHDYSGGSGFVPAGGTGKMLLKAPDALHLCLSCHDGKPGIPDVVGPDVNGLSDRSAGFFEPPDTPNTKGHRLASGLSSDPTSLCNRCHSGDMATAGVTCTDCHNPHGNGNPRNLQWASQPGGEPRFGLLTSPGATGMQKYERANVAYGTLNSDTLREVSNMCLDCHHVFSGGSYIDPNGTGIHTKHPTYDSERSSPNSINQGAKRGTSSPDHWVAGTGSGFAGVPRVPFVVSGASDFSSAHVVSAESNGVFCLSCHKAHGSGSQFGLNWPTQGGSGPSGCDQCHAISGP